MQARGALCSKYDMTLNADGTDLTGQLLIAMPGMGDPRFANSVVFLCAYSDDGAMGLIINKPNPELSFAMLAEQLEISMGAGMPVPAVHYGGPVEHGRGFVLHSADYVVNDSTLQINDDFGMTATLDILQDIARGEGPNACLLALGYSGWAPGQLEEEIRQNGWLTVDADPDLVFRTAASKKW